MIRCQRFTLKWALGSVAKQALMCGLTHQQKEKLKTILTAKGKSSSDLILDVYGNEDKEASRRVEFKFSLRDADMISEMNDILQSDESMNGMPVFGVVTEE